MKNTVNVLITVILAGLLSACSQSADKTLAELERLCKKDAGVTVYKTVVADGYYDANKGCHSCWNRLIESHYSYLEYCDDNPRKSAVINEKGCWRIYKDDKDSKQCHKKINELIEKNNWSSQLEFRKNSCIAIKKVDFLEAKYELYSQTKIVFSISENKHKIVRYEETVYDRSSKSVVAKQIEYNAYIYSSLIGGAPNIPCSRVDDGIKFYPNFVNEVIGALK